MKRWIASLFVFLFLTSLANAKTYLKGGLQWTGFPIGDSFSSITGCSAGLELSNGRNGFEFGLENDNKWLLKGLSVYFIQTYRFFIGKRTYAKIGVGVEAGKPDYRYNFYTKEEDAAGNLLRQKWLYVSLTELTHEYKVAFYPVVALIAGTRIRGPFYLEPSFKLRIVEYGKKITEFDPITEDVISYEGGKSLKIIPTIALSFCFKI